MATRRDFLRGVSLGAGGMMLSPLLQQIQAEAAGVSSRPVRFLFVLEGNGLNPEQICPKGITYQGRNRREKITETSLADTQFTGALSPIDEYKDRVTILQGLSGRVAGGGHSNDFGALGAYKGSGGNCAGPTIDAALAAVNPGLFPIVNLGMVGEPHLTTIYNCSAGPGGQKLPTRCRPDLAYNTLFGSVAEGDGRKDFQSSQGLLDFMAQDIRRVKARIGSVDSAKLDSYLEAYESLSDRQSRLIEVRDQLAQVAPVPDDKYTSPVETDRLDAQFDIATAALIGQLTNVVTIASGVGTQYFGVRFTGLGIDFGKHGIGHGGSYNGMTWAEMAIKIRTYHFSLIHRTMKRLAAIPEGDGTMLDNTLIIYMSDAAEGHHSRCWEWPFVVIGDLGGRLKKPGRYIEYPDYGKPGHRTINSLYNTFLHAAGKPTDDFGDPDLILADLDQSGPLVEVLA